jgi:glycosyltransferase involved in cell wall biosynthesis
MRIAIVGPAHPYKGGIAQETTELAHRLTAAGHQVKLLSWKAMYPKRLYPGEQYVAQDQPERPPFAATVRVLSWKNPIGWWSNIRRLQHYDQIIFIWWVPTIQGPVYLTMLKALGKQRPYTTIICHNVLPHEARLGDRIITRAVLRRVDTVVTHTDQLAETARGLTARPVISVPLPLAHPAGNAVRPIPNGHQALQHRLLFFGIVRKYKGLDILLRALALVPDIKLTAAGEFWDVAQYEQLIKELGLSHRVTLQKGYVPSSAVAALFASADALVLPYRHGTGSQNVQIAFSYGLPVIGTAIPAITGQLHDGTDGLLCTPDDVEALAATIRRFYKPGVASKLRAGISTNRSDDGWTSYLAALGDNLK